VNGKIVIAEVKSDIKIEMLLATSMQVAARIIPAIALSAIVTTNVSQLIPRDGLTNSQFTK